MGLDHRTTCHQQGGSLWDLKYSKAQLRKYLIDGSKSRGFTSTWTASKTDSGNWMFTRADSPGMIGEHSCISQPFGCVNRSR